MSNQGLKDEGLPEQVSSLLITLKNNVLLLPNVAVAEIIGMSKIEKVEDKPDWLIGMINWRELNIPLISYEKLKDEEASEINSSSRIAIINGVQGNKLLPFYGVLCQGIPRLTRVFPHDLSQDERSNNLTDAMSLRLQNEEVIIPAFERIEQAILKNLEM